VRSSTMRLRVNTTLAKGLKRLAEKRAVAVGELVPDSVSKAYQVELSGLDERQQRAVTAYQGGYIGLGRLAEELGMTVWDLRAWLYEHDIPRANVVPNQGAGSA
jgi:predicted HTH domain antitoxin